MRRRHLLTQTGLWAAAALFPPAVAARLAVAAAPIGQAVGDDNPQRTPYQQLFPQPTGQNGYEEIVLAGMAARDTERRTGFTVGREATLTQRRQFLGEREVRRALSLLRQGLAKPIQSPHQNADFSTLMPDLALVRALARVLAVEEYVHLADGRTAAAIDAMADGLRLARVVSGTFLIGGLVGAASESLVLTPIATYRDQFCVRDCTRLLLLVRQFLEAPDPLLYALEMERRTATQSIPDLLRQGFEELTDGIVPTDEEGNPDAAVRAHIAELERLRSNPAAAEEFTAQVRQRINAALDRQIAWHRDPSSALPTPEAPTGADLADFFAGLVTPVYGNASRRFAESRIRLQLVGVHAAIRRYRWEHERLPASLDELRLKGLEIDPYTRQQFVYRPKDGGADYELASAGPFKRNEQGNAVPGQREAIVFPRPPVSVPAQQQ